jgi:rhodanese-related sulfurtransferase
LHKSKNKKVSSNTKMPLWAWILLAVVVLAAISVGVAFLGRPAAVQMPDEITAAQASTSRDQGALILDVRQPEEWAQFHIPGAVLIPLGDLPARLNEVPKDREVVVVCRTGHRSAQGRDILRQAGYTNVTSLAGGVTQWQAQGLPITSGQ